MQGEGKRHASLPANEVDGVVGQDVRRPALDPHFPSVDLDHGVSGDHAAVDEARELTVADLRGMRLRLPAAVVLADQGGGVAGLRQRARPRRHLWVEPRQVLASLRQEVGDAELGAVSTGEHRRSRGAAHRGGGVAAFQPRPVRSQAIEVGGQDVPRARRPQGPGPLIVGHDEHEVGARGRRLPRARRQRHRERDAQRNGPGQVSRRRLDSHVNTRLRRPAAALLLSRPWKPRFRTRGGSGFAFRNCRRPLLFIGSTSRALDLTCVNG